MKKEYDVFIGSPQKLPQGREIELTVRDLTLGPKKYDRRIVRAIVSSLTDQMPEGDILWLRSFTGALYPHCWAIKIVGEQKGFISRPPYSDSI